MPMILRSYAFIVPTPNGFACRHSLALFSLRITMPTISREWTRPRISTGDNTLELPRAPAGDRSVPGIFRTGVRRRALKKHDVPHSGSIGSLLGLAFVNQQHVRWIPFLLLWLWAAHALARCCGPPSPPSTSLACSSELCLAYRLFQPPSCDTGWLFRDTQRTCYSSYGFPLIN